MKDKRISRRALLIWELFALLIWLGPAVVLSIFLTPFSLWWNVIFWPGTGIYLLAALFYLPMLYRSTRYGLSEGKVLFEQGIFFHRKHYMNRERIVFVTVMKTPLTPVFRVSSLVISATGGKIHIPFLDNRVAKSLAQTLSPDIDL